MLLANHTQLESVNQAMARLPAALVALRVAALLSSPTAAVPTPTRPQLDWQRGEMMALIHFNMATFFREACRRQLAVCRPAIACPEACRRHLAVCSPAIACPGSSHTHYSTTLTLV